MSPKSLIYIMIYPQVLKRISINNITTIVLNIIYTK